MNDQPERDSAKAGHTAARRDLVFGGFHLDGSTQRLWHDGRELPLGRKAAGVLLRLASRAGALVTKDELLGSVWEGAQVGEAVLTTAVREIRSVLGDAARKPRFVETIHGRGYRFVAPVRAEGLSGADGEAAFLAGRSHELACLDQWLDDSLNARRRVVYVSGAAGSGKTALLDAFAAHAQLDGVVVARGQCLTAPGCGEVFLPVIEALRRILRLNQPANFEAILRREAPDWVGPVLEPSAAHASGIEAEARMVAQLCDALEAFSREQSLLIVLEDLHWSDTATLNWLAYLARRRDASRALVVCSFRRSELTGEHPLGLMLRETRHADSIRELVLGGAEPSVSSSPNPLATPPMVGRRQEWQTLQQAWQQALSGQTVFVLIGGESGIGKSRLALSLQSWVQERGEVALYARNDPASGRLAFGPVLEWLNAVEIKSQIAGLPKPLKAELSRLLPDLAQGESPDPAMGIDESLQAGLLYRALSQAIGAGSGARLLILDDLQWCDLATVDWLQHLLTQDAQVPLMLVAAVRSEELAARSTLAERLTQLLSVPAAISLELEALNFDDARLLAGLIGDVDLDDHQAARLYQETDGHPLYVGELIRAGWLEQAPGSKLPSRLQAVIEARLQALPADACALAEIAAVIGGQFDAGLLREICEAHDAALDTLWQARILSYEQGRYEFVHDKIREVAYAGIHPAHRQSLHRQVAEALLRRHASDPSPVQASLVKHYEQAALFRPAVECGLKAARVASAMGANHEARGLLDHVLELLLKQLPSDRARDELEFQLRIAQTVSHASVAYRSEELLVHIARAVELSDELAMELPPQLLRILAVERIVAADLEMAEAFGERMSRAAGDDPVAQNQAVFLRGAIHGWRGEISDYLAANETVTAACLAQHRSRHILEFGHDLVTQSRVDVANALWHLGRLRESRQHCDAALETVKGLKHPPSTVNVMGWSALLFANMQDIPRLTQVIDGFDSLEQADQFPLWVCVLGILRSILLADQHSYNEALALVEQGLAALQSSGQQVHICLPQFWRLQAEYSWAAGRHDMARAVIAQALNHESSSQERVDHPELLRLRGEYGVDIDPVAARDDLWAALAAACESGQRMWQLRAAVSLARLAPEHMEACRAAAELRAAVKGLEGEAIPELEAAAKALARLKEQD